MALAPQDTLSLSSAQNLACAEMLSEWHGQWSGAWLVLTSASWAHSGQPTGAFWSAQCLGVTVCLYAPSSEPPWHPSRTTAASYQTADCAWQCLSFCTSCICLSKKDGKCIRPLCLHGYFLYHPHKQGPRRRTSHPKNSDVHGNCGMGANAEQY